MPGQTSTHPAQRVSSPFRAFFQKNRKRIQSDLILLLVAMVWGSAFVPQRIIANQLGVFVFNGTRFILGGLVLLPLAKFRIHIAKKDLPLVCLAGCMLFIASALQQAGLKNTTAANAGFITGLYVVIVPILISIFWKHRLHWISWLAAFLSVLGLFLLSVEKNVSINPGDTFELAGATFWALHIIIVGIAIQRVDVFSFSIIQFFVCGILNLISGLLFEFDTLPYIPTTAWAILYTGIFSVGIGYTLQALGQKHSPPTDASIILSMEAVFAALFGYLFIHETLTAQKIAGCLLLFAAIILAQLVDTHSVQVPG